MDELYFKYDKYVESEVLNIILIGAKLTGKSKFLDILLEQKVNIVDYKPTLLIDYRPGTFNFNNSIISLLFTEISSTYLDTVGGVNTEELRSLIKNISLGHKQKRGIIFYFIDLSLLISLLSDLSSKVCSALREYLGISKEDILIFVYCENEFIKKLLQADKEFDYKFIKDKIKNHKDNEGKLKFIYYVDILDASTIRSLMIDIFSLINENSI